MRQVKFVAVLAILPLLAASIAQSQGEAGAGASEWSAKDYVTLNQTLMAAMKEWGNYSVELAKLGSERVAQDPVGAFQLSLLQVYATKIRDVSEALFIMESLCASITDPAMRRHGLLLHSAYYEKIVRSGVDAARMNFEAGISSSQYADIQQIASQLLTALTEYDRMVLTPRGAELGHLKVTLGVDLERDGNGP